LEQSFQNRHGSSSQWTFNFSGLFQLPKEFSVNVDFATATPLKSLYGEMSNNPIGTVHINKSFLNRSLNVSLMFNDIFNSIGSMKQEYYYNGHSQISNPTYHGFTLRVNVRYSIRWGKKSIVRRGGSGNTQESKRLATD
jgi:hypothetical protein